VTGSIHIVVGGQYGSEAKGHIAAQLHKRYPINYAVRVGGPNAGHSAADEGGKVWALRTIPVAAVVDEHCKLVVSQGSEIDMRVLEEEITMLEDAGFDICSRLYIDVQATMLTLEHHEREKTTYMQDRFGSTAKGIGAARADRLMRKALLADQLLTEEYLHPNTRAMLQQAHENGEDILIEGTQGWALGLHAGRYPYCTSNDCAAVNFLAQTGIQPHNLTHNWVVFRTYPIRVAGNSGPMYSETDWDTLGAISGGYIQAERTTVTKKIRRVGQWDSLLAAEAIEGNGGKNYPNLHPVLTFVDYLDPSLASCESLDAIQDSVAWKFITDAERELGIQFEAFTTSNDVIVWRS
jgi:adenylosuccinate synthase